MSSILKALKKVEEEKAAQRIQAPLATDVTRTRNRRPNPARSPWALAGACAFVGLAAVVSTYAAMGGFSGGTIEPASRSIDKAPLPASKPEQSPVASPAPTVQYASATVAETNVSNVPAVLKKEKPAPVPPIPALPKGAGAKAPAGMPAKPAVLPSAFPVAREPQPYLRTSTGPVAVQHPVAVQQGSADFTVTGIAWQKESSSRLAVVNGVGVTQGKTVDGAKVLEILPDRVRLSRDNHPFEIMLGK